MERLVQMSLNYYIPQCADYKSQDKLCPGSLLFFRSALDWKIPAVPSMSFFFHS